VFHPLQNLDTPADDIMGFFTINAGYKTDSAGIVLIFRPVQTFPLKTAHAGSFNKIRQFILPGKTIQDKIWAIFMSAIFNGNSTLRPFQTIEVLKRSRPAADFSSLLHFMDDYV
jgi:hypothetical protein